MPSVMLSENRIRNALIIKALQEIMEALYTGVSVFPLRTEITQLKAIIPIPRLVPKGDQGRETRLNLVREQLFYLAGPTKMFL